jgi:hypothetical protein
MFTGRSIDTLDPESTEHSLLNLTISVSVLTGLSDRLFRDSINSATGTVIPFGRFHHLFMATVRGDTSFYSRHFSILRK